MDSVLKISFIESSILHISLNRPESLNVLNANLLNELQKVLLSTKENAAIKALLITGTDKAFCAGADIKELAVVDKNAGLTFSHQGQLVFRTLEQLGKPSLAAIHGFAFGGGCELAMSTSLRIADTTAVFAQPEVKLGVIPGFGGTQRLARLVGKGRALDLCLTGRTINAEEAKAWGLISEVVAPEILLQRATEILTNLIKLPPLALKSVMDVIDEGFDLPLSDALDLEAEHFAHLCGTKDKTEGVQAFLEKRLAKFSGE